MSYILDALKKSEQERQKGEVPGLGTQQGLPGGRFETDRLIWLYALATLLLLAALAVGAWLFLRKPEPAPVSAPPPVSAPTAENEKPAPQADMKPAAPARTSRKPAPAPSSLKSGSQSPPQSLPKGSAGTALPPEQHQTPRVEVAPAVPMVVAKPPTAPPAPIEIFQEPAAPEEIPATPEAKEKPELMPIVPIEELPAETKAEMPELKIGVHLYSDTPASRRASINGRLMREGQTVDKNLVLEEITRQGAILSFRGRRFTMPVFPR